MTEPQISNAYASLPIPDVLPKHIAIIMDGNNRYAKAHGMAKGQGHVAGKESLDPLVEYCVAIGIEVLTVFAFSSENWQRPVDEVALLMRLLSATINEQLPRMHKYNMCLRFIGDRSQLTPELQQQMADAEAQTANHKAMTLVIAISYGGQWDIANAAQQLAKKIQQGKMSVDQLTVETLGEQVQLADVAAVDMLIRTGGEYRISNFLLWQSAYAELFFTDTLWPDFDAKELNEMMFEFSRRQRRFGKTSEQVEGQA
ncbi:polyprenyl diphosphate synthase [Psychrobacter sp.]|uniref:polyprenyl diphosphate synthase n=1 Tax=Psychrobacter sp. TaxID=56811 RepID=UPI0025E569D1|nr:polyprenyl diphosphate synthase [Psychrobacter sp.]